MDIISSEFHLNLLKMTATMSKTKIVMMAMVITRFVAILEARVVVSGERREKAWGN
jgi:hypothetical protein